MNSAQGIALYLSIDREVHGNGATVSFPGEELGYHSMHSDTFQYVLAKMEIYAATNIETCGNERVFNVADGKTVTWAQVWPQLVQHFGLVGQGPASDSVPIERFVKDNNEAWRTIVQKYGLKEKVVEEQNWGFVHFMLVQFDFNREYDLLTTREVGFQEQIHAVRGYILSWERMSAAKNLPPLLN